jgi:hypothetical protein
VVHDPVSVDRRVSASGLICVATQRIYVGKIHAGKTVTVHARPDILRVDIEAGLSLELKRPELFTSIDSEGLTGRGLIPARGLRPGEETRIAPVHIVACGTDRYHSPRPRNIALDQRRWCALVRHRKPR